MIALKARSVIVRYEAKNKKTEKEREENGKNKQN